MSNTGINEKVELNELTGVSVAQMRKNFSKPNTSTTNNVPMPNRISARIPSSAVTRDGELRFQSLSYQHIL